MTNTVFISNQFDLGRGYCVIGMFLSNSKKYFPTVLKQSYSEEECKIWCDMNSFVIASVQEFSKIIDNLNHPISNTFGKLNESKALC